MGEVKTLNLMKIMYGLALSCEASNKEVWWFTQVNSGIDVRDGGRAVQMIERTDEGEVTYV